MKKKKEMEEDAPTNSVAGGGIDLAPHARKAFKPINVTDRRSKKRTVLLKRFRDYIHQQNAKNSSKIIIYYSQDSTL